MRRRDVLTGGAALGIGGVAMAQQSDYAAYQARLWSDFPYERIEVPGTRAPEEWMRLAKATDRVPIVVGNDEDFLRVAEAVVGFLGEEHSQRQSLEEILSASQALSHPDSIYELRRAEEERTRAYFRQAMRDNQTNVLHPVIVGGVQQPEEQTRAEYEAFVENGSAEPDLGEWPAVAPQAAGLSVAEDILKRRPHEKVHIVLLPTRHAHEAPAYLRWGGWNSCPAPEYQVAALRSWNERYGAVAAGMSGDVMNVRVARRPASREEALRLAREQYAHCSDIVEQGVGTLSNLAAGLMADDWWYFWWD